MFSHALAFAVAPIVGRLYGHDDFGQFGLFFGLANVLVTMSLLGLHDALIAAKEDGDAKTLLKASVALVLCSFPILGALAYCLIRFNWFGYGALPEWTAALIVLEIVAIAAVGLVQAWLVRGTLYRDLAKGHLVQGITRASGQVGAGVWGLGFLGLGLADSLTRVVVAVFLLRRVATDFRAAAQSPIRKCVQTVWRFRAFVIYRTPSMLAFNLGTALPPVLVTMAYDVAAAGLYTFMSSIIVIPVGLIQKAVGDVFLGHFAARFRGNPALARRFLAQTALGLLLVALPLGAVLLLWGGGIFATCFGENWREAGHLAGFIVPLFVADMAVGPLGGVLTVVNRPDAKLIFDTARIGGFCGAYVIAVANVAPLTTLVSLFAWFGVLSYGIYLGLIVFGAFNPRPIADASIDLQAKLGSPPP